MFKTGDYVSTAQREYVKSQRLEKWVRQEKKRNIMF